VIGFVDATIGGTSIARVLELTGGTFSIELHDVLANDEHAAALITIRGERAGRQLNDNTVQTYHIRDGAVAEVAAGSHRGHPALNGPKGAQGRMPGCLRRP